MHDSGLEHHSEVRLPYFFLKPPEITELFFNTDFKPKCHKGGSPSKNKSHLPVSIFKVFLFQLNSNGQYSQACILRRSDGLHPNYFCANRKKKSNPDKIFQSFYLFFIPSHYREVWFWLKLFLKLI